MSMNDIEIQVFQLRINMKKLLDMNKRLKDQVKNLKDENARLQRDVTERSKKLEDLENKNLNLQISKSFDALDNEDVVGLRERLDEFIQEIDECIQSLRD